MPKINIQPDCGNAPRKIFLKDLYVSLANADNKILHNNAQDNINWQVAGQTIVTGKENYLEALKGHPLWRVKEITVDTIITHGPDASVSGQITATDNLKYSFCDIYRFKGAGGTLINSITTFLVRLD
ncbi:MAG: hypothetical protein ABIN36_05305 [Ferruginibacter sp.]